MATTLRTTDPFTAIEQEIGSAANIEEKLRLLLNFVVLAPSSHNSQPWRFRVERDTVELFADRTRSLPVVDPDDRALVISCGAALYYLRLVLRCYAFEPAIAILPDAHEPDLLARVIAVPGGQTTERELKLFRAIPRRRTNRHVFASRDVSADILGAMQEAAVTEGAWVRFAADSETRSRIAELVVEGDRTQWADKRFRRELASWIHPSRTGDGMVGDALGITPLVIRTFDMGKGVAARDIDLAHGSPVLAVFGTLGDGVGEWLVAGQALAGMLLTATSLGVAASFLNQPVEVEWLRPRLAEVIGHTGHPQLLLRFGYGDDVPSAPRRPVEDVLIG